MGEECFKASVKEMQRLEDYQKYKISLPLVNWASCLAMDGRYSEAEEMLLGGLADRVEYFGEDDQESFMLVFPAQCGLKLTRIALGAFITDFRM
jgi:hypothetical protein